MLTFSPNENTESSKHVYTEELLQSICPEVQVVDSLRYRRVVSDENARRCGGDGVTE